MNRAAIVDGRRRPRVHPLDGVPTGLPPDHREVASGSRMRRLARRELRVAAVAREQTNPSRDALILLSAYGLGLSVPDRMRSCSPRTTSSWSCLRASAKGEKEG
jgi:hypothetical protein